MQKFIKSLSLYKQLLFIVFCWNALVPMEVPMEVGMEEGKDNRNLTQTNSSYFGNINFTEYCDDLTQRLSSIDCSGCRNRFVQGTKYVCELGAEVLVSVAVVGGSLVLISVASSLQEKGEEQGAHYETRSRYVCSYDSDGNKTCKTERYTECVGPYEACQDLDAASALFAIGGCGLLGTGAFWCYKIYNDYERYCLGRRDQIV